MKVKTWALFAKACRCLLQLKYSFPTILPLKVKGERASA